MKEEQRKILDANVNRLFSQHAGFSARFTHQANEMISLQSDSLDVDSASGIINGEYQSTLEVERCVAFIRLRTLSEIIYDTLGSEAVCEHIKPLFSSPDESSDMRSSGKISYMRNKFTEKAFDKFTKFVYDAKIIHSDSFEDSCMDTYNGICEYCILPTENSSDGKLSAFYKLIKKYDLHIAASTEIHDGDNVTTVSLVSRDIDLSKLEGRVKGCMLEFEVACTDTSDIGGILTFAFHYGLKLVRIDSHNSGDEVSFSLLLSADDVLLKNIEILTFCLSSVYPSFNVIGLYKHIN
ncbi:MAG: hypothetical protein IIX97_08805 [Clostridia bacterium]|nr:hypothetical protein [Clostridia bacterium]